MASRLVIGVATLERPGKNGSDYPRNIPSWHTMASTLYPTYVWLNNPENLGVVGAYQKIYEKTTEEILCYIHDDVTCREQGWDQRILAAFDDPKVGVVGCGGALHHGADELYRKPYVLTQLARFLYHSNTDDAEEHGERFSGVRDVAVVDGFFLAVRRALLDRCSGWHPEIWPPHHLYDYVICAQAHRYGYRVQCVGIRCHHHGGRTATSGAYLDWAKTTEWGSDQMMHEKGHRLFYDEFKDVMPWRTK